MKLYGKTLLLLLILVLISILIAGCGGNGNTNQSNGDSPSDQATLTFAAGEWYAQQTAIAVESTPHPPDPGLSK